jgi:hypothetical protein
VQLVLEEVHERMWSKKTKVKTIWESTDFCDAVEQLATCVSKDDLHSKQAKQLRPLLVAGARERLKIYIREHRAYLHRPKKTQNQYNKANKARRYKKVTMKTGEGRREREGGREE